jgi:hypothetical protein
MKDRTRLQLAKSSQIREEEPPSFDLALAAGARRKVLLDLGFLFSSQLSVQELLDLL